MLLLHAGGATALIAAAADEIGPWYGFKFVLTAEFGALGMTLVALLVNNLSPRRVYPTFW
jgi:CBS domain-containing membrane protein